MKETPNPLETIFHAAQALPSDDQRRAYLAMACGNNLTLRQEVERLLAAAGEGDRFFARQPVGLTGLDETVVPSRILEGAGSRIGRYKLLEQIGEGGMGIVYMAEQEEPVHRRVALKIIKLGMDTHQVVARFEAERQALALMDHPNIARVLDGGSTETGRPYFVMELVQGMPITEFCDRNQLPAKERLALFVQVCQAIQSAHQKGIIHRDLKPSNILVTLHHGEPMARVIDFGIAKATNQKLTEKTLFTSHATMIGTPAYMSPEQAELSNLDVDTRSDLYSLGVLLYELLTSSTPFPEKRLRSLGYGEMQRVIREEEPERPSARLSTMSKEQKTAVARNLRAEGAALSALLKGDLDWIVMKCLEKDRRRRYDTANGLASDVQRYLNNEPILARPPSAAYRLRKFVRRHQMACAAGLALAATLVLGTFVSTWQAVRAHRATRAEVAAREAERSQRMSAQAAQRTAEHHLYVANMNLAQQAWEQNNVGRLRQILNGSARAPERGFEWRYWMRQTHLEFRTLRVRGTLRAVAFSPDGQRLLTGSGRTVTVWEPASGRKLHAFPKHPESVISVVYSKDGRWVAAGGDEGTVKVWDAVAGSERLSVKGPGAPIGMVAFSPDGLRMITGSFNETAQVWETSTGKELLTIQGPEGQAWWFNSVACSADGRRVAAGRSDDTAQVWDAATGRVLFTLKGHEARVGAMAFSPDGLLLATGSADQTVRIWAAEGGAPRLTLRGHTTPILSVAFSADGRSLVSAGFDQTARVWETETGRELRVLRGHSAPIDSVAFSPDMKWIATSGRDSTAKLWGAAGPWNPTLLQAGSAPVCSAAFSPDGRLIVAARASDTAVVWEVATGKKVMTAQGFADLSAVVAFSPDGQRIVTSAPGNEAKVWEVAEGRAVVTLHGHTERVTSVAFSPDGRWILTGSDDQTARVWEAASGQSLRTFVGHTGSIKGAVFAPNGQRILTGSDDGTARLWDPASGTNTLTFTDVGVDITAVAFSPDGRWIVTGGDREAKIWEAATGRERLVLQGHSSAISSVAFSPDGQRIVTGSGDQTVKVWESTTARELLTLKDHRSAVMTVAFSPDGLSLFSGGWDGTSLLWSGASDEQIEGWQKEEDEAEAGPGTIPPSR